jgi:1-deoxyxylulose-5-phosphate synthase
VNRPIQALHDLAEAGQVRYPGASSMRAWQFATVQDAAESHGRARFISMQEQ